MLLTEIPYHADSASLFSGIAQRPWAMWLDSGLADSPHRRYDILVADPVITLTTRGDLTEISRPEGTEISREDPFGLVRDALGRQPEKLPLGLPTLPFMGGAVGYWGYDLARRVEKLPMLARDAEHLPEMQVGIYDWAVVVDHLKKQTWLASYGRAPLTRQHWDALVALFCTPVKQPAAPFKITSAVTSNMDAAAYGQAFRRVQHYIHEGDCYQINLAQRFSAQAEGDGWAAYRLLRQQSPAPFAAFLNLPGVQILSASPERFLQVRHKQVLTQPIKGTRPRHADPLQDQAHAEELLASDKDRAENVMIVDLLRNDIGKNCVPGSVKVANLFALESYTNVHHMVSTISGQLASGHTATHLLRGCFPGGSITGAPKLRAMEIIETLEPHRRGVYCGAIGYIGFDGSMDTNIAIRTAVYADGQIRFWAGGGIVADSIEEKEYRETWDKAANMLKLMEAFK